MCRTGRMVGIKYGNGGISSFVSRYASFVELGNGWTGIIRRGVECNGKYVSRFMCQTQYHLRDVYSMNYIFPSHHGLQLARPFHEQHDQA
jgi:hypothetical protein